LLEGKDLFSILENNQVSRNLANVRKRGEMKGNRMQKYINTRTAKVVTTLAIFACAAGMAHATGEVEDLVEGATTTFGLVAAAAVTFLGFRIGVRLVSKFLK